MQQTHRTRRDVVIDVWFAQHPFPGYLDPVRKLASEFEKSHPGYQINVQGRDFQTLPRDVALAAEGGDPPDLAEYYYTATQLARDTRARDGSPLFTSIEQAIGGRREILDEPVVLDDMLPTVRDYYTFNGDSTSVPVSATTTVLYANTTLLDRAGVSALPRTWSEVEAVCRAIAALPGAPAYGITWALHGWLFQQAVAGQGGLLADRDNGRSGRPTTVDLVSDEMLAYVNWWQRLYQNGHFLHPGDPWDWFGTMDAFARQEVALTVGSSKLADHIIQMGRDAGFDVEVGMLPHNDAVPHAGHMISGQSFWLADGLPTAKQDAALAFLQYLLNPVNLAAWHKASAFVPITEASIDLVNAEGGFDQHPHHRVAVDQIRRADGSAASLGPMLGDLAGIQDLMVQAMQDVLLREQNPVTRFGQANDAAQQLLDSYNAHCLGPPPSTPYRLDVA